MLFSRLTIPARGRRGLRPLATLRDGLRPPAPLRVDAMVFISWIDGEGQVAVSFPTSGMRLQPHRERFRGVSVIFPAVFTTKIVRSLERFPLRRSHGVAANSKPSAMKLHAIIAAGATRGPTDSACFAWITSTGQGLPARMKCQAMLRLTPAELSVALPLRAKSHVLRLLPANLDLRIRRRL